MPLADPESEKWFAEQVRPHEAALRFHLRRVTSSLADVDDVVQDSYLRLFKARRSGEIRTPKAMLFTIARNAARDLFRRKQVADPIPITENQPLAVLSDEPSVAEAVCRQQELALLEEAMRSLPSRCREVLMLRKIHQLSQREIASRLGISENTVESLVGKGSRRCADFLRAQGVEAISSHGQADR